MDKEIKTITVYEDIQDVHSFTPDHKKGILELKNIIGSQNVILQEDNSLLIKKYVGFYVNKKVKLQILPKIFSESSSTVNKDEQVKSSIDLFFRLLSFTDYSGLKNIPTPISNISHQYDILEIFIELFTNLFLIQYKRAINRNYESQEENLILIKGKILFGKSILRNSFLNHRHYCEYDEFTENNILNKIFKSTFFNLLQITDSSQNKSRLKLALTYLENVDRVNLSKEIFDKIKFTRLNENYRPIFNLAKMFYHNSQPGFRDGDELTFSFLIPLNLLFEYFAYKLVRNSLQDEPYKVFYQKPTKHLAKYLNGNVLPQRPDIVVKLGNDIVMILDAKYSNLFSNGKLSPSISNIYQLISYSVNYGCDDIFIISPYYLGGDKLDHSRNTYVIKNSDRNIMLGLIQLDMTKDFESLAIELSDIIKRRLPELQEGVLA